MKLKNLLSQYPRIADADEEVKEFLNSLSEEDLKHVVIDYNDIDKIASFENPLSLHMSHRIYGYCSDSSALTVELIIDSISSYFNMFPSQIKQPEKQGDKCVIKVCIPHINNNLQLIKDAFRLFEYRLSTPIDNFKQGNFIWLFFEPKDDAKEIRIEETTLYFLIPYRKRGSIKHFGCFPYSMMFNYFRNVYLLRGSMDKEEIRRICALKRNSDPDLSTINKFALYTLDLNKISDDVKLYLDPNNHYGIYTPDTIFPDAIKDMEELIV